MQRDSDSDANPSNAQEDDQMLKPKEKKPKKKKSKTPVIVPASAGENAGNGRVSVVSGPAQQKKNLVKHFWGNLLR